MWSIILLWANATYQWRGISSPASWSRWSKYSSQLSTLERNRPYETTWQIGRSIWVRGRSLFRTHPVPYLLYRRHSGTSWPACLLTTWRYSPRGQRSSRQPATKINGSEQQGLNVLTPEQYMGRIYLPEIPDPWLEPLPGLGRHSLINYW